MNAKHIKSRERVIEFGEVLTPPHIVEAMLDLVADEARRVDSRFLEPACGTGNFLVPVLRRKLVAIRQPHAQYATATQMGKATPRATSSGSPSRWKQSALPPALRRSLSYAAQADRAIGASDSTAKPARP